MPYTSAFGLNRLNLAHCCPNMSTFKIRQKKFFCPGDTEIPDNFLTPMANQVRKTAYFSYVQHFKYAKLIEFLCISEIKNLFTVICDNLISFILFSSTASRLVRECPIFGLKTIGFSHLATMFNTTSV